MEMIDDRTDSTAEAESHAATPLILVAEDEPDTLAALSSILRDAGYRVLEASTGVAALDRARRHDPDLVLLDLGLPEMNGLDVARLLNDDRLTAATPIIALTGSWLADEMGSLYEVGFAGALRKPFRPQQLVTLVRGVLQQHPSLGA